MSTTAAPDDVKRCGLFGGTFDPVHNGHLALARTALAQLGLNHVRWLPTGQPWQKLAPPVADHHRIAMLQLALDVEPNHVIDERELRRPGPTYTIDTLDALHHDFPGTEWDLIIGQDQLARMHTWHRWQELTQRVGLAVVARGGQAPRLGAELKAAHARMTVLAMPPVTIASTDIRWRIEHEQSIEALVPEAVARYIDRHGLYRRKPTGS